MLQGDAVHHQHVFSMKGLISAGEAKITNARSPLIPPGIMTGWPGTGPVSLPSVLKRRLNSQKTYASPVSGNTVYVSPQWVIERL